LVSGVDSESHEESVEAIRALIARRDFGNGLVRIIGNAELDMDLLHRVRNDAYDAEEARMLDRTGTLWHVELN
jgi:hypothetical protein